MFEYFLHVTSDEASLHFQSVNKRFDPALRHWRQLKSAIMHHDPQTTSPVSLRSRRTKCLIFADISSSRNFAEFLPTEIAAKIFSELDAESLCRAAQTCSLWRHIIESSQQLWKNQCLLLSCQREVDLDRRYGLSWKLTLKRNYVRSRLTTDWLRGRYSSLRSSDELSGRKMVPLDVETWGEILEAELSR